MTRTALQVTLLLATSISILSCDDKDDGVVQPTLVKEWTIPISTKHENPAPPGRTETGTAEIQMYSNNTLTYHIMLSNLTTGDAITAGHLHTGDPVTNGPVILNLAPTFSGLMSTGTVDIPRQSLADSIKDGSVYINLHSTNFPAGLVRGQLDQTLDFVMDVPLTGASEVPAVNTTATGLALLRLTANKKLFYRVNVTNVEANDALTMAHIHNGAAGANGGVLVGLAASAQDFNVVKSIELSDNAFAAVKANPVYVNVHSNLKPQGLIRGQIR